MGGQSFDVLGEERSEVTLLSENCNQSLARGVVRIHQIGLFSCDHPAFGQLRGSALGYNAILYLAERRTTPFTNPRCNYWIPFQNCSLGGVPV